jgi:hypothetical protein
MLEDVIKTLLDLSKLDAGVSKPEIRGVAIGGLIDELFTEFAPVAAQCGLNLRWRGTASNAFTDPLLLRRILQNLLSNAIRYTRQGGVLVYCEVHNAQLRIDIADTGPGIRQERRTAIFEEFQRDDPGTGNEPGFGLGLAIVRRLATAMGHQIKLWSRPGFGSVFSVLMPYAQNMELLAPETDEPLSLPFEDVQILLISPNPGLFEPAIALLEGWGCEIAKVEFHEAARAHMQRAERTPDLLIAECIKDETGTGAEIIHALRIEAESMIPSFLFSLESRSHPQTSESGLEILHLPVMPSELRALIAHLLQPRP